MKKLLYLFSAVALTLTSCSDEDDSTNASSEILLTRMIETFDDGSTLTTNFLYNGNKLVEWNDSDGARETFVYNGSGKLVSGIERSQFQSKLEDSQANITKKDVFDLITSFADSSTPTFTIPSNDSSTRQKSLMVANAFDLTGPIPEYDLLFSKGIFVRVDIPPHQLLQIYKLKNEEPKTTGKKKRARAHSGRQHATSGRHL